MGKMFASYSAGRRLISTVYKELKILASPKIKDPVKKWTAEMNRHFDVPGDYIKLNK